MTFRALILGIVVLLSPQAMSVFSQVAKADIISGYMDLDEPMTGMIYATGRRDGITWEITCKWVNGLPQYVVFGNPIPDL